MPVTILSSVIIYVKSLFKSHKTVQFDFVDCSLQLGEKAALSPWLLINCVNVVRGGFGCEQDLISRGFGALFNSFSLLFKTNKCTD